MGLVLVIMAVGAIVSAIVAAGKQRNALAWAFVGAMFPLISFIIILALEPLPQLEDRNGFTG